MKKIVLNFFIVFFAIVVAFCVISLGYIEVQSRTEDNQIDTLRQLKAGAENGTTSNLVWESIPEQVQEENDERQTQTDAEPPLQYAEETEQTVLAQYQAAHRENPDMFGWIAIDGTVIDYPVMQTPEDPTFYLHRSWKKEYSYGGLPLVDGNATLESENIIIYGHNMNNGSMFGQLKKYKDKAFYQSHPVINFDTIYESGKYQIIGVLLSEAYLEENPKVDFNFSNEIELDTEAEFQKYVTDVKRLSLYDTGVQAQFGDKLITLVTCHYHRENGRLLVVAKKVG